MGETTYKMKKMTALAICAALAVSGCAAPSGNQGSLLEPTQRADDTKTDIQVQKPPAYVYYVKEADLMRADVNSDMVPGVNPSVIMEGIGEGAGPRSYYDAMHPAKDGSFLIFDFEAARDSSTDWRIVAVDPENGKAELVHEAGGQVYTLMCGGKALIHAQEYSEDTGDTVFNLYSYAPGEGRQLLLADIFDFNASKDGSVIAFTRLDPEGGESLYILRNGEETRLADEMGLAGADEGFDNIYGVRYTYGEAYCTLTRMSKILIVEDEESIAELEKDYLELSGFEVEIENDGTEGLSKALKEDYDLLILDLMLPGTDGFEICKKVREVKNTPIIMVSAKKEDIDKIRGLGLGADDYITKPFSPSEMVARVKAHMARYERLIGSGQPSNEIIEIRGLKIDKTARRVWINGEEKTFTTKEFDLLTFLAQNPNHVFTKEELFSKIWDMESIGDIATVTVHIKKIREKIEFNTAKPQYIETIWGVGYRFKV